MCVRDNDDDDDGVGRECVCVGVGEVYDLFFCVCVSGEL